MKKVLVLLAAAVLLFGFSSQALAAFAAGDLIQVVYKSNGTGNEVITDLGNISTWTASNSLTGSGSFSSAPSVLLSSFPAAQWSDLNVAYFTYSPINGTLTNFWMSGPQDGQTNYGSAKAGTKTNMGYVIGQLGSASQVTIASSSSATTYWQAMDKSGLTVGGMGNFINSGNAEANLAALASGGSANLSLYYYPTATDNAAGTGVKVANLSISTTGTSYSPAAATPVPPSILLMGSGLLGLVGIRRKKTV